MGREAVIRPVIPFTALRNLMASYTYIYLSLEKPLTSSSPMSHECCGERAGMVSAYNIGSAALPFLIRQYAAVNVLGARERFFVAPIIAARRIFFFGRAELCRRNICLLLSAGHSFEIE